MRNTQADLRDETGSMPDPYGTDDYIRRRRQQTRMLIWVGSGAVALCLICVLVAVVASINWLNDTTEDVFSPAALEASRATFAAAAESAPEGYVSQSRYAGTCTSIGLACRNIGGEISYEASTPEARSATAEQACAVFAAFVTANAGKLQAAGTQDAFAGCPDRFDPDGQLVVDLEAAFPAIVTAQADYPDTFDGKANSPTVRYSLARHWRYESNWVISARYSLTRR